MLASKAKELSMETLRNISKRISILTPKAREDVIKIVFSDIEKRAKIPGNFEMVIDFKDLVRIHLRTDESVGISEKRFMIEPIVDWVIQELKNKGYKVESPGGSTVYYKVKWGAEPGSEDAGIISKLITSLFGVKKK